MYKAVFTICSECIDELDKKIYTPFVKCYIIHSAYLIINGIIYQQGSDFIFEDHFTKWISKSFPLEKTDSIIMEINYFYIRNENDSLLSHIVERRNDYSDVKQTNRIISNAYADGQFSLDNGLYRNAVLNFGTVLEGVLNTTLSKTALAKLIESYNGKADKSLMCEIKDLRNCVHPNQIARLGDVTSNEAIKARNNLEYILFHF